MNKKKKGASQKQNDNGHEEKFEEFEIFEEFLDLPKLKVQRSVYEAGEQMKKEAESDKDGLHEWDLADLRRAECKENSDREGRKFWIKVRDYLKAAEFAGGIEIEGIEVIGDDEEPF